MLNNGRLAIHTRMPAFSRSGYGVASRQILDYLMTDSRFHIFLEKTDWGGTPSIHAPDLYDGGAKLEQYYRMMHEYEMARQQNLQFDISIQCTIANEFERRARLNIGCTAGIEVDRCAYEWVKRCNQMDLIVVPSEFSKKIMTETVYRIKDNQSGEIKDESITRPIHVIPHWFEHPPEIKPSKLQFSTSKNLLFVGLWGNKGGFGEDRKNIADLVRLFCLKFGDNADYGLILKTSVITNSPQDLEETKKKIETIKANFKDLKCKIYLVHEYLTDAELYSLYTHPSITGVVSLTHGEGFGLPLLEATSVGLPVIATNWSGHLDFCRPKNGFIPLECDMVEIPECQVWENIIEKGSRWAKVSEDDFTKRIKKFLTDPKLIQKQAQENKTWVSDNFGKDAVMVKWKAFYDSFIKSKSASEGFNLENEEERKIAEAAIQLEHIEDECEKVRNKYGIEKNNKKKVLYVMPQSFGDSVISTSVVNSLIKARHSEDEFYVATQDVYVEVYDKLVAEFGVRVIKFEEGLLQTELTKRVWDYVYCPGVNVQYVWSNWNLGNGEYGLTLLTEFAKNCNLHPAEVQDYKLSPKECWVPSKPFIAITPVSSKQSKSYKYWDDIVSNIKKMVDVEIVQLGTKDETIISGCIDMRGKTYNETMFIISKAVLNLSPDTGTAHVAGALKVPHVVMFASTAPEQCAPTIFDKDTKQVAIVANKSCKGCYCYKDVCALTKDGKNCLSNIEPQSVCNAVFNLLKDIEDKNSEKE